MAGVVVPAHDEEDLLPACLAALQKAAGQARIPVHLLVVADSCTDGTAVVAADGGAEVMGIRARNVGAARAASSRPNTCYRPPRRVGERATGMT